MIKLSLYVLYNKFIITFIIIIIIIMVLTI